MPTPALIAYAIFVSLLSIFITAYDKIVSHRKHKRRVSENTLLFLAILGGSVAEYLTMLFIRHKTKHKKFMIGLPLIVAGQIILIVFLHLFVFGV